jgi:hypothetical protein
MKTKTFIFLLFLCAEILISAVAIKQFNDEKQCIYRFSDQFISYFIIYLIYCVCSFVVGATEESKTKFAIDHWTKTTWRSTYPKKAVKGEKKIEQSPIGSGSGGNGGEGSAQGEGIQNEADKEI